MNSRFCFDEVHASLERWMDNDLIAMASCVILSGQEIVDEYTCGFQDREQEIPLAMNSIFRLFSNTKPITAIAAMTLWEEGKFQLDDEIASFLPRLANLRVLKKGTSQVTETEPLERAPTVRQLMCHTAGFSYGLFLESPVDALYTERGVLHPASTLSSMVDTLSEIPLAYQPGDRFQYSVASDVLGRLIEVWSGESFGEYIAKRIFEPLGMHDTAFYVPESKHNRFCSLYAAADPEDPLKPGLSKSPDLFGDYTRPRPLESGGGGLVGTITDYTRFVQMLMGGGKFEGKRIVSESTLNMMRTNQFPEGVNLQLPNWIMPNTVFGLGFALKQQPAEGEPFEAVDEFHWGGLAGTHSWMSPRGNLAALVFTQRMPGFWHPYSHEFKRLVYQAMVNV
ncbi:MAG: serine hydrolase [Gammaproteobacteria bacterium]|nr:serine hydrolase [Gammaproteobacteria bacterium]